MNRPRNRQSRPPRQNHDMTRQSNLHEHPRGATSYNSNNVPSIRQVVSGAAVSIVLKVDQPTGHEVQGVVQDVLTRGNHPRGIKVRLQDGRVGRVQRMAGQLSPAGVPQSISNTNHNAKDYRSEDQYLSGPPPRSLADFLPPSDSQNVATPSTSQLSIFSTATITCPICGNFEGDEVAVTHHVEEHLR